MSVNNIHQAPPTNTNTIQSLESLNPKALNTIFIFIATFFLTLLQLKSQGDHTISPFSTNPLTILLSTIWLLFYCCAFAASLKPSPPTTTKCSPKEMMIFFGILALISLGSLLFPSSVQHYALYSMNTIIGLGMVLYCARLRHQVSQSPRGILLPLHIREITHP